MHELGIVTRVVDIACERSAGAKVRRIVLEIGQLSLVAPDAVRFEVPGRGRCRRCRSELALASLLAECSCGHYEVDVVAGQELRVKEMEVI